MNRERFIQKLSAQEIAGTVIYGLGVIGVTGVGFGVIDKSLMPDEVVEFRREQATIQRLRGELSSGLISPNIPNQESQKDINRQTNNPMIGKSNVEGDENRARNRIQKLNSRYERDDRIQAFGWLASLPALGALALDALKTTKKPF